MLQGRLDLPLAQTAPGQVLPWLTGGLVYAVVVLLAVVIMADQALLSLDERAQLVTVTLPLADDADVGAALDVLYRDRAVIAATPLQHDELGALMAPWLGETRAGELPWPAADRRHGSIRPPSRTWRRSRMRWARWSRARRWCPTRARPIAPVNSRPWCAPGAAGSWPWSLLGGPARDRRDHEAQPAALPRGRRAAALHGRIPPPIRPPSSSATRWPLLCAAALAASASPLLTVAALLYSSRHLELADAIELGPAAARLGPARRHGGDQPAAGRGDRPGHGVSALQHGG